MTKEEILYDNEITERSLYFERAKRSMDEFSKQECIEFGVWLHYNWQTILGRGWILQRDTRKYDDIEEMIKHLITIEEVYNLYLQQKTK